MSVGFIGYDVDRVRALHPRSNLALESLRRLSSDDPVAAGPLGVVARVAGHLSNTWMPLIERVLDSDAMLSFATTGMSAFVRGSVLGAARSGDRAPSGSLIDQALAVLLARFAELDEDGDGQLSGEELLGGACGGDAELREACDLLLDQPLVLANVALVGAGFAWHGGGDDLDVDDVRLTRDDLGTAIAQNRVVRMLADPLLFAGLDRARTGTIDGRVSTKDVRAFLEHEDDPDVRAALEHLVDEDLLDRIDRESPFGGSDGRIAYDQVYALALHQGALLGLPDPTIPPALRDGLGPAEDTGDTTPQFLHGLVDPVAGVGQVMMVLYIPTPTAGLPGGDAGKSVGNDRGPDPHADPSDSKAWVVIDYETGLVTVRVNPSCSAANDGACSDPLPIITDFGSVAYVAQRIPLFVDDSNRVSIDADDRRTKVRVGVLNADKRVLAPRLDATFRVSTNGDGTVHLEWDRGAYPSLEAYHVYPDGRIVAIADENAAHSSDRGLLPLPWTDKHGSGDG